MKVYNYLPLKCEMFSIIRILQRDGWYAVSQTGSHIKMKHLTKKGLLIVPNHGSSELGRGLELRLGKLAGLNRK